MSIDMTLYGLTKRFEALAAEFPSLTVGRILSQEKGIYRIIHTQGVQAAAVSGRYRYEARTVSDYPAVGDFVMLDGVNGIGQAVIHALLPRKSMFVRKAAGTSNSEQIVAANVDLVFICMSLNNDFNLRRLERYLSVAWDSGAVPVILLTKADLCEEVAGMRAAVSEVAVGVDILVTSSMEQDGYESVLPYLKNGQTIAFIGSSGVGKSTLINRLLGGERIKTNGLRSDDKGRHTTTHRELICLPGGGIVIDTPGMRELGMWDASEGVEKTFADIEELAHFCKFKNCTHHSEPGCGIQAALERGTLSPERWRSYQKLRTENAYAENSESYLITKERKFKDIAKINRTNRKK